MRSHDPSCTPCTPHSGSTSRLQSHMRQWHRWHARSRYIHRRRARMGCGPGTCLRMQVFNAGRRMPGEGSRREEPLIRQRQLHGSGACIVHSDGQRPAHRHTNACTSAANRRARPPHPRHKKFKTLLRDGSISGNYGCCITLGTVGVTRVPFSNAIAKEFNCSGSCCFIIQTAYDVDSNDNAIVKTDVVSGGSCTR